MKSIYSLLLKDLVIINSYIVTLDFKNLLKISKITINNLFLFNQIFALYKN